MDTITKATGGSDVDRSAARAVPLDCSAASDMAATFSEGVAHYSLEERLAHAERELECARMIDSWSRCQQETARWSRIVTDLKRQIAERDERLHVENCVIALGDRHAG